MSGYLSALVAHAAGREAEAGAGLPPPLRLRPRSRFEPDGEAPAPEAGIAAQAPEPEAIEADDPAPAPSRRSRPRSVRREPMSPPAAIARAAGQAGPVAAIGELRRVREASPVVGPAPEAQPPDESARREAPRPGARAVASAAIALVQPASSAAGPALDASSQIGSRRELPAERARTVAAWPVAPVEAASTGLEPARDATPGPPPDKVGSLDGGLPPSAADTRPEPPSVRVSIGRIEVTVAAPASSVSAQPAPPPSATLAPPRGVAGTAGFDGYARLRCGRLR
jgi:hypothetical protein